MKRLILFTYLTLSVFMSSTWKVNASSRNVENIQSIYYFLLNHKSGDFKEYAELIKKENNINAKNSQYYHESGLHIGRRLISFSLLIQFNNFFFHPYSFSKRSQGYC
jgi:hypothetical protein